MNFPFRSILSWFRRDRKPFAKAVTHRQRPVMELLEDRLNPAPVAPLQQLFDGPDSLVILSPDVANQVPFAELANARVFTLDPGRDALTQVSAILANQSGLSTLRIISHGHDGSLSLAGQALDTNTLQARSEEVAAWGAHFAPGADILLYGCSVASTSQGKQFVDTLAKITGTDVAASSDLTGAGGNITLEYKSGAVNNGLLATQEVWAQSGLDLPDFTVNYTLPGNIDARKMNNIAPSLTLPTGSTLKSVSVSGVLFTDVGFSYATDLTFMVSPTATPTPGGTGTSLSYFLGGSNSDPINGGWNVTAQKANTWSSGDYATLPNQTITPKVGNTATPLTVNLANQFLLVGNGYGSPGNWTGQVSVVYSVASSDSTSTALTSSLNPAVAGQSVTFTATVANTSANPGTPTGSISFYDGATLLGTGTLNDGVATLSISSLASGVRSITAKYLGDSQFAISTSAAVNQTVNEAPAFTSANSTAFQVGSAGTFQFTTSGYPAATYSVTSGTLPLGVTLTSGGLLSGTPGLGTTGISTFTVTATNGINPIANQAFTLTVNEAPAFTNPNSTTFQVGSAGTFQFTTSGYPAATYAVTTGTLPAGLTLTSAGLLSGTPAAATSGISSFTVTATNGISPVATQAFSLTVNEAPAFTNANSTSFQVGSAGTFQFTTGGYPAATYAVTTGTLPTGLTLTSAGLLSGTPAAGTSGVNSFTVTATNSISPDASQGFTLTVNEAPAFTNANSATFSAGVAGAFPFTSTGYPASFTYTVTAGALPSGLTLNPVTGLLSGTVNPALSGDFPVTIQSSNTISPVATQNFTIHVLPAGGLYDYDSKTGSLTINLSNNVDLDLSESKGMLTLQVLGGLGSPTLTAKSGSALLPGDGTNSITINQSSISSFVLNNLLASDTGTDNDFQFTTGDLVLPQVTVDMTTAGGIGGVSFLPNTTATLSGNLVTVTNGQGVSIEGDLTVNTAAFFGTTNLSDVSLTGSKVNLAVVGFNSGGLVTLGDQDTDQFLFGGGVSVATQTRLGGTVTTNSNNIVLNSVTLVANTVLNTKGTGAGASITLSGGINQNGHTLTTYAADGKSTTLTGNLVLDNSIEVYSGGVTFGDGITPTTVSFTGDTDIFSPTGPINFGGSTTIDTGAFTAFYISDDIGINPATAFQGTGDLGFRPATSGVPIFLGTSASTTNPGLKFGQSTLDQFGNGLNSVQFGDENYSGNITVGTTFSANALYLSNPQGGKVRVNGTLEIGGGDSNGVGLLIAGSGATTILLADIITPGVDVIIDDAVEVAGANIAIDTTNGGLVPAGADITITGGTAGIYSTKGANNNLTLTGGTSGNLQIGYLRGFGTGGLGSTVGNLTATGSNIELFNKSVLAGAISLDGVTSVGLDADVSAGGSLGLAGPVVLGGDVRLTGTTVTSTGAITGNGNDLSLNTTSGSVITGAISDLDRLIISNPGAATEFKGAVTVQSIDILASTAAGTPTVQFDGNLAVAGNFSAANDLFDLSILGSTNTIGGGAAFLNTGLLLINDDNTDVTRFASGVARTLDTKALGTVAFGGDVILTGLIGSATGTLDLTGSNLTLGFATGLGNYQGLNLTGPMGVNLPSSVANVSGALSIRGNSISQTSAGIITAGNTTLASSGNINLLGGNIFNGSVSITAANAQINDTTALDLAASTLTGNLIATSGGALTQSGTLTVAGTTNLTATGSDITLDNASNSFIGAITYTGGNVSLTNNRATVLGTSSATGNLLVDSSGNISQTGPLTVLNGNATFNAGTGTIVLTNALNDMGDNGFVSVNANTVGLTDADDLQLGTSSVNGNYWMFSGGNITQSGALTVGGYLDIKAFDGVILNDSKNTFGFLKIEADNAQVTSSGGMVLDRIHIDEGSLTLNAGGNVTQVDQVQVVALGSVTTINAPGFDVILPDLRNDFITATVQANNLFLADANNLTLSASNANGNLTILTGLASTLNNNTIAGATAVNSGSDILGGGNTFTGTSRFEAGRYLWLNGANSSFGGSTYLNGSWVQVRAAGDIVLNAGNASILLDVSATGNISQDKAGDYINVSGNSILNAGGDISFTNTSNVLVGDIIASGKNITIANTSETILNTTTATGDLTLIAPGGANQVNPVTVAGKLDIQAAFDRVMLTNSANSFPTIAMVADHAEIATKGATTLLPTTVRDFTLAAGGNVSQLGALTADSADISAFNPLTGPASITLNDPTNRLRSFAAMGGTIIIQDTGYLSLDLVHANSLSITIPGDLYQTSILSVSGPLSITADEVTLESGENVISGDITLNTTTASITNATNTSLANVILTGGLTINATGAITQSSIMAVGGNASFTGTDITLQNSGNNFGGTVGFNGANVAITDSTALALAASSATGTLALSSGGTLSQSGELTAGGATTILASDILLNNAGNNFSGSLTFNGANVTIHGVGNLALGQSTAAGNLNLAGVNITQTGSLTVAGTSQLAGTGDVTLNSALNDFVGAVTFNGVNVHLNDANDLLVQIGTTAVDVHLTANGTISESDYLSIGGWTFLNAGKDIQLGVSNTFVGQVQFTGNNVNLVNSVPLMLGNATAQGALFLEAPSLTTIAPLSAGEDANLTLNGPLVTGSLNAPNLSVLGATTINQVEPWTIPGITDVSASGAVVLDDPANDFGLVTISGTVLVLRDANDLNLGGARATNNINLFIGGSLTQTGAILTGGNLNVSASGDVILTNPNNNVAGPVAASGVNIQLVDPTGMILGRVVASGHLDVNTSGGNGNITQTGPISVASGTVNFAAGTGKIILDNPLNEMGDSGTITITASDATLVDVDNVLLGAINVTGNFSVSAGGDITQSAGVLTGASAFTSKGDIVLENTGNAFGSLGATGKNISATSAGALDLSGINGAGNLILTAGGNVTQTGPVIAVATGALTTINAAGFDIDLNNLLNDSVSLTATANNMVLGDTNALQLTNSKIGGNLNLYALGDTNLSGDSVAGTTLIQSGGDFDSSNSTFAGSTQIQSQGDIYGSDITFGTDAALYANDFIYFAGTGNSFGGATFLGGSQVEVNASGDLLLDGGNINILLIARVTGSITQTSNYINVSGNSALTAGGAINLTNTENVLVGSIDANASSIAISNNGPVILGTVATPGALTITGSGISQTGTINAPTGVATLNAETGDILLGGQNSLGTVILSGNNITLMSFDSVVLGGLDAAGNVNLTSGGSLSQTIPITIRGTSLLNTGKDIRLGNAQNSFGQAVSAYANGLVDIRASGNLTTGPITTSQDAVLQAQNNLYVQGEIQAVTTSLGGGGIGSILAGPVYGTTLNWDGAGSLELAGAQHYTSDFLINKGWARVLGNNILPKDANLHVLQDALFSTDAQQTTIKGLYGAGEVSLGTLTPGELIINNPVDALFSGVISGKGWMEKTGTGTQIFTGNNTFTGGVLISGGTLQLGNQIDNGGIASDVLITEGTLSFQPGSNATFANDILSRGTNIDNQFVELRAPAGVALGLSGANQFLGTTTNYAGILDIQSNIGRVVVDGSDAVLTGSGTIDGLNAIRGVVAPGNTGGTGTLTVLGAASFGADSILRIGLNSASTFGVLNVSDMAALGLLGAPSPASLEVTVDPAYVPEDLQTYKILTANPVLNRFAQGTVIVSGPYYFRAIYSETNVTLQKVPAGVLPGASPLIVAPGAGQSDAVVYTPSNEQRARIQPMGSWTGGMRSSVGDVTGDGWGDYIFAAAPGGGPRIVVVDGVSLQNVSSFYAYTSTFSGGVYVGSGDINGDGVAEIVTGAGATGGPHVQAFNVSGVNTGTSFFAYSSSFKGGVTVATGDLDGDGIAEIITGAASNGGAHVRSFNANGVLGTLNFFAYAETFQGGVRVAAGDINGDGLAEVITGPGPSGSPNVKFFDSNGDQLTSFYAYLQDFAGGVTVGVIDPTNSGTFTVVTGPGSPSAYYPGPRVNLYTWDPPTAQFVTNFLAYPNGYEGGVWVA